MKDLLQTLDAHAHLTPDEIAAKIKPKRWIKGLNMTNAEYETLCYGPQNGRVRLAAYQGGGDWWLTATRDSACYTMDTWPLPSLNNPASMGDYWFIPYEDSFHGDHPAENT